MIATKRHPGRRHYAHGLCNYPLEKEYEMNKYGKAFVVIMMAPLCSALAGLVTFVGMLRAAYRVVKIGV
jgi:hypothetical protein